MSDVRARLARVTVRATVTTVCPNGGSDHTEVAVSWRPGERMDAEVVQAIVAQLAGQTLWCEDIACFVATSVRPLAGACVRVSARQLEGHGVEAVAIA